MVFFIVCVDFQSPVRLVGHVHCSVEKFDVTNFVHAKRVSFDVVRKFSCRERCTCSRPCCCLCFNELGKAAVFIELVSRSVEATIGEDYFLRVSEINADWSVQLFNFLCRFLLCLHYFGVQSEGVGYRCILIEVHYRVVPGHRNRFFDPGSKFLSTR